MGHLKQYNKRQDKRQHLRRGNKPVAQAIVKYNTGGSSSSNINLQPKGAVTNTGTIVGNQVVPQANFSSAYANLRQTLPMQQTSWLGLISAGVPALATTIMSGIQYANARRDAKNQQALVDNLMSQYMSKPI